MQSFLSLCQGNHYQFDTLRRAKHSSMMVLYHIHNPNAPAFASTCNVCNVELEAGAGFRWGSRLVEVLDIYMFPGVSSKHPLVCLCVTFNGAPVCICWYSPTTFTTLATPFHCLERVFCSGVISSSTSPALSSPDATLSQYRILLMYNCRCTVCPDFDICANCKQIHGHPHPVVVRRSRGVHK